LSKNNLLAFQILALAVCIIVAAAVGIIFLKITYEQSSAEEMILKREFNRCVESGNYDKVEQMIKEKPELVNLPLAKNSQEYAEIINDATPLIVAGADTRMVRLLLDNGADVNQATPITHRYPLTSVLAISANERFDIAWLYISKGADLNCVDYVNGTAPYAMLSCECPRNDYVQKAAAEFMRHLIRKGVSTVMPDKPSSPYTNILGLAAQNNYYRVIEDLYRSFGYDLNKKVTEDSKTPLMIAAKYGNYNTVTYLIYYGAREHFKDDHGRTAYDYAKTSGNQNVVEYLS
jgi:ankyrin repeat protein